MGNKTRYFIVMYIASVPKGQLHGELDIRTKNYYLNKALTVENIKEGSPDISAVVITNIVEINKKEWEEWTS